MPDSLFISALTYDHLCKEQHHFTLDNGEHVHILFKPQNFVHLAGLRKFRDVYEFSESYSARNIYHRILQKQITIHDAERSVHYNMDARERIENLKRIDDLLQTKRVIWNFDPKKVHFKTNIKSRIIFFHWEGFGFYLLFGAAPDGITYYPETFFLRFDDAYIRGQTVASIVAYEQTR